MVRKELSSAENPMKETWAQNQLFFVHHFYLIPGTDTLLFVKAMIGAAA
jgi:hypothetical protein